MCIIVHRKLISVQKWPFLDLAWQSKLQNQQKLDTCLCTINLLDYSPCKYVSKGQKGHLFSITLRGEKQHVVYKSKYGHSKQLRVPLVKTVYGKKLPERRRPAKVIYNLLLLLYSLK